MNKKTNSILSFLGIAFIPIGLICVILLGWLAYYYIYLVDNTIVFQSNFVSDATYSEDKTYFMEVQVFSNVIEVKLNYYVDTSLPVQNEDGSYDSKFMMSSGVQFYTMNADEIYSIKIDRPLFNGYSDRYVILENCTYYNKPQDQEAYVAGGSTIANENKWIYDIGGELCAIQEKGRVKVGKEIWTTIYDIYDISRLIIQNYYSFQSFREGITVSMFNFSKYFDLYMDNGEGHFTTPVQDENILEQWTYVDVKITTNKKDMVSAKQSLFGSYKGDPNWTSDGGDTDGEVYWTDYTVYDLNNEDFRYIESENGYELELKQSCIDFLDDFNNLKCDVIIELDAINPLLNIIGFTQSPFGNISHYIDSITITSSEQRQFHIYEDMEIDTVNVEITSGGV